MARPVQGFSEIKCLLMLALHVAVVVMIAAVATFALSIRWWISAPAALVAWVAICAGVGVAGEFFWRKRSN
jgi:hypothetical protein